MTWVIADHVAGGATELSVTTVSYTHLDVYKRQTECYTILHTYPDCCVECTYVIFIFLNYLVQNIFRFFKNLSLNV